jgi:hypothetical protein
VPGEPGEPGVYRHVAHVPHVSDVSHVSRPLVGIERALGEQSELDTWLTWEPT